MQTVEIQQPVIRRYGNDKILSGDSDGGSYSFRGIIGQIDAANEMNMKRQIHAEAAHYEQADRQLLRPEIKTAMATLNEKDNHFP
ncbi:hypothetical protein [Geotalea toluenoxydans]|uniref:hypothetical protein n=1 Tax=Geotalea toluenoxydans TaxID=421624 RepID=UPI0006CF506D|nr:hypothetical protein [Geotalea toluenoxydans]